MVVEEIGIVVYEVPVPNEVPPLETLYQLIVPEEDVAPKVTVPGPQTDPGVVPVMVGTSVTVTVCVTEFVQPARFLAVYVITAVPAETPVTKPVAASTVATGKLSLVQAPPVVASPNWVVEPTHNVKVPVIAATVGKATTVAVTAVLEAVVPQASVAST